MNPQDLQMYLQNLGIDSMGMGRMPPRMRNMMNRPMPNSSLLGNSQLPPQLNNIPIEQILAQVINNGGNNGSGNGLPPKVPPNLPPMPMQPPPMMRPPPMTPQPVRPPIRRV